MRYRLIPSDIVAHIAAYPPTIEGRVSESIEKREKRHSKFRDEVVYPLIGRIFLHQASPDSPDAFVRLSRTWLRGHIGRGYPAGLKYLLKHKILESSTYIAPPLAEAIGKAPRTNGYRISEDFLSMPELIEVNSSKEKKTRNRKHMHLWKWIKSDKIAADLGHAIEILEEEHRSKGNSSRIVMYQQCAIVMAINKGVHNFRVDETGERLHTNITRMKRSIRGCLRYDGKKLVSVDIRSCQPLLLCWVHKIVAQTLSNELDYREAVRFETQAKIKKQTKIHQKAFESLNLIREEIIVKTNALKEERKTMYVDRKEAINLVQSYMWTDKVVKQSETPDASMLSAHSLISNSERFPYFKKLCENGGLYSTINSRLKMKEKPHGLKDTKRAVIASLSSSNRMQDQEAWHKGIAAVKPELRKMFPSIADCIHLMNSETNKGRHGLSGILTRIETSLMLGFIAGRISNESPDMFLATIHDCILTTEGNEAYVTKVIKEEFQQHLGLNPSVSTERLTRGSEGMRSKGVYEIGGDEVEAMTA